MSFPRYPKYKDSGVEWVGQVPDHWEVGPVKRFFKVLDGLRVPLSTEERSYRQGNFPYYGASGIIDYVDDFIFDEDMVLVSEDGANLLARATPIAFVAKGRYWVNNHAHILKAPDDALTFWSERIEAIDLTPVVTGAAQPKLTIDALANLVIAVPPTHDERKKIARFVETEVTRIDALVAEQEQFITLLKEKRQAVISHAVTKGLDLSVRMKNSGVEWLGKVPEHWSAVRLKFLASNIKAGPFGSALTKDMYVSSGYRVYGQEQVIPGDFSLGDYYIDEATFAQLAQYATQVGDVLISCVGTFGKIAVVPESAEPGIINPRLLRLRVVDDVSPNYLAEVLRSTVTFEQFSLLSRGGTMDVINISTLSDIWVAVPPYSEQQSILEELQRLMREFDALVDDAVLSIELLRERRSAFISAAVTGQIDVRGLVTAKEAA